MHYSPRSRPAQSAHSARVMLSGYEPVGFSSTSPQTPRHAREGAAPAVARRGADRLEAAGAAVEVREGEAVVKRGRAPLEIANSHRPVPAPPHPRRPRAARHPRDRPREIAERTVELHRKVRVTSQPAGAQIEVDGKPAGARAARDHARRGAHDIAARYRKWPVARARAGAARSSADAASTFLSAA